MSISDIVIIEKTVDAIKNNDASNTTQPNSKQIIEVKLLNTDGTCAIKDTNEECVVKKVEGDRIGNELLSDKNIADVMNMLQQIASRMNISQKPNNKTDTLHNASIENINSKDVSKVVSTKIIDPSIFGYYKFCMRDFQTTPSSFYESNDHFHQFYHLFTSDTDCENIIKNIASYKTFGCVLNTDFSSGGGIHWICIFIDNRTTPKTVELFDSTGTRIDKEFVILQATLQVKLSKYTNKEYVIKQINDIEHQTEDSECGVYCLYYICKRIEGAPYTMFCRCGCDTCNVMILTDNEVHKFREYIFKK